MRTIILAALIVLTAAQVQAQDVRKISDRMTVDYDSIEPIGRGWYTVITGFKTDSGGVMVCNERVDIVGYRRISDGCMTKSGRYIDGSGTIMDIIPNSNGEAIIGLIKDKFPGA